MTRYGNHKFFLSRGLALLFAGLYLLVSLSGPLHELFNHSEVETEICVTEEADACHLALVHNDVANGCEHESHFSAEELSCDLCSLIIAPFHIAGQKPAMTDVTYRSRHLVKIVVETNFDSYVDSYSLRGPPVTS
jgi:hypothetical protein